MEEREWNGRKEFLESIRKCRKYKFLTTVAKMRKTEIFNSRQSGLKGKRKKGPANEHWMTEDVLLIMDYETCFRAFQVEMVEVCTWKRWNEKRPQSHQVFTWFIFPKFWPKAIQNCRRSRAPDTKSKDQGRHTALIWFILHWKQIGRNFGKFSIPLVIRFCLSEIPKSVKRIGSSEKSHLPSSHSNQMWK